MFDSIPIGRLVTDDNAKTPTVAPKDAVSYCIDCFTKFGFRKPLPDGWWGERRRVKIDGIWNALCHNHFDKRDREKILRPPQPRVKKP